MKNNLNKAILNKFKEYADDIDSSMKVLDQLIDELTMYDDPTMPQTKEAKDLIYYLRIETEQFKNYLRKKQETYVNKTGKRSG